MNISITEKRDVSIDLIKTIAIIGVILIHLTGPLFSAYPVGSLWWNVNLLIASCVRASVPLFFMCSGALLLSPEKKLTIKKLYTKTIPRILVAMIFWGIVYKIFNLIGMSALSFSNIWQAIKEVLLFNQEFHFYYMHIILIVYVLLPITRLFVKHADKHLLLYALGVWFVFGIVYPTVKGFWPFNLLGGMTYQWYINMTYAAVGYGLLGYYLKKFPVYKLNSIFILAGAIIIFFGTYILSIRHGYLVETFFEGMSVGTAFLAVGIFSLLSSCGVKTSSKPASVFRYISASSFCIYLVHMFFINILRSLGIADKVYSLMPLPISHLVLLLITFAGSTFVYFVISKVPVVKKWII